MKLLLDTCTFLWVVSNEERLTEPARAALVAPDADIFLSAVSAWEIAMKQQLGTLRLSEPAHTYVPKYRSLHEFSELPLVEATALQVRNLPPLHKDPFDRMLICQAVAHGMAIVTPDAMIARYPVRVIW